MLVLVLINRQVPHAPVDSSLPAPYSYCRLPELVGNSSTAVPVNGIMRPIFSLQSSYSCSTIREDSTDALNTEGAHGRRVASRQGQTQLEQPQDPLLAVLLPLEPAHRLGWRERGVRGAAAALFCLWVAVFTAQVAVWSLSRVGVQTLH